MLELLTAAGFRSALPTEAEGSTHQFTGRTDGRRIDHIFVNERFDIHGGEVIHLPDDGRLPSDHWPVIADLELRA